ncbi:unnamed protein product [Pieris brassicae]|uniref:Ionotropic glutamate receptor C-terminal domain-containing protein n=1 Tax=Pieris brassicae TaxID=7116 RepID=A0A9P0TMZ8_PIEBR|nr:unnamed protein product [Pieris brassicae]
MNTTYTVGSLFKCDNLQTLMYKHEHDPIWRQTALGCYVLDILKDMLQFNVTYAPRLPPYTDDYEVPSASNSIDIYVRPMMFKREYLADAYPINFIFQWRFGFLLRYKRTELKTFFTLPFSTLVWTCLIWTLFLSASVFYLLSYWEKRLLGGERCLQREFLLAFSAYCQQILPLQANLSSRRIAYVIFILSAYVIHCFYTSTLLSHLVNDKDKGLNLEDLANTDYEFVIIKDMNLITEKHIQKVSRDKYLRIVEEKIYKSKVMDVYSALEAVRDTKTAVLTDYVTLYPVIKRCKYLLLIGYV